MRHSASLSYEPLVATVNQLAGQAGQQAEGGSDSLEAMGLQLLPAFSKFSQIVILRVASK